jgi:hypothetical protein
MVDIVVLIPETASYFLQTENGERLPRDKRPLHPGKYWITANGTVTLNPAFRACSRGISGPRVRSSREAVRKRDRRCVITRRESVGHGWWSWVGFEAAHIFPLAHESYWNTHGFGRYISLPPATGGTINSVQNGHLLDTGVCDLFDEYFFAINPDVSLRLSLFLLQSRFLLQ